jgi:hypothetical protein
LDEQFRERLEVQLSINALSAGLHSRSLIKAIDQHPELHDELIVHLEKVSRREGSSKPEGLDATYLHKAVKTAATLAFLDKQEGGPTLEHVLDVFSEKNIHVHQVTSYDLDRFLELKDICLSRIDTK